MTLLRFKDVECCIWTRPVDAISPKSRTGKYYPFSNDPENHPQIYPLKVGVPGRQAFFSREITA